MKIATIFDYLEPDTVDRLEKHHKKYTEWLSNTLDSTLKNPVHYINASAFVYSVTGAADNPHVINSIDAIGDTAFLMKSNHLYKHFLYDRGIKDDVHCQEGKPCVLCAPPSGWQPTLTNTTRLAVYPVGRVGNDWIFSVWNHQEFVSSSGLQDTLDRHREMDSLRGISDSLDGVSFTYVGSTERHWTYAGMIQISPLGWHCETQLTKIISTAELRTNLNPSFHCGDNFNAISDRIEYLMSKRLFLPYLILKRCLEIIEPRTKNKEFEKLKNVFCTFMQISEHERQAHTAFRWILPHTLISDEPVYGQRFNHAGNLVMKVRRPIKATRVKRQSKQHLNPQRTA